MAVVAVTDRITLEMNVGEALFVLDAVTKAATEAHRIRRYLIATHAGTDERAITDLTAEVLDRIELRMRNELYPCEHTDVRAEWSSEDRPWGEYRTGMVGECRDCGASMVLGDEDDEGRPGWDVAA